MQQSERTKSTLPVCLQSLAAQWLSQLLDLCKDRTPCPNSKIIKNLCSIACSDPLHTPTVRPDLTSDLPSPSVAPKSLSGKGVLTPTSPATEEPPRMEFWNWNVGIITLVRQQKQVRREMIRGPLGIHCIDNNHNKRLSFAQIHVFEQ